MFGKHTATCRKCGASVRFRTYRKHWPTGWVLTIRASGRRWWRFRLRFRWLCPTCADAMRRRPGGQQVTQTT